MGPRSHHTAQEGDAFGAKRAYQSQKTAKDLVKMLEETGIKLFISTVQ
jgi:hypothetical protein